MTAREALELLLVPSAADASVPADSGAESGAGPEARQRMRLAAPGVGYLTCALQPGAAVAPGQVAGVLLTLGREATLIVPAGAYGVVVSERPERVHLPVGHGDVVLELDPSGVAAAAVATSAAATTAGPVVRAAQSGRFYRRTAPDQPPFVEVGTELRDGVPIGLIEVMKTFSHVVYRAQGGLPAVARVTRIVAGDGADIEAGAPLLEIEPA